MHLLIKHADQVIGEVAQITAIIKIRETGIEHADIAEAVPRF
jgi:hypothetical protein